MPALFFTLKNGYTSLNSLGFLPLAVAVSVFGGLSKRHRHKIGFDRVAEAAIHSFII